MKTIGFDIGTTTISAVVMDTESKRVVEAKTIGNNSFIQTGKDWERIQDVSVIIPKAIALLDEMLEKHPDAAGIGLTGQMHGILYLDENGECISPLYTWQDGSGTVPLENGQTAVSMVPAERSFPVATGYGLVTHLYHTLTGKVPEGAKEICTVPDYLGMKITGRTHALVHSSMAASMSFYNTENGGFFTEMIEKLGMDPSILPEVTEDVAVLGNYKGRPVTIALGDNQASFMGSVGLEPESWLLNVGTGGQMSVLSDVFFEAPGIETRPYVRGKYLLAGSTLCAGRAYAILEHFFRAYAEALGQGDKEQYGVMAKLVENVNPEISQMKVSTTFKGTRVNPDVRGGIENLSEDNFTPGGMVLGVLTGIADELHDMYNVIYAGTGIGVKRLLGSGNGVRKNPVLQKIFEEMFGAKLELSVYEEEAASGAAVSCALALEESEA